MAGTSARSRVWICRNALARLNAIAGEAPTLRKTYGPDSLGCEIAHVGHHSVQLSVKRFLQATRYFRIGLKLFFTP